MKLLALITCAIILAVAGLVALEGSTNISGRRSPGFPIAVETAVSLGHTVSIDDLAHIFQTVCLVPEYTSATKFLSERGFADPPKLYVGELNTLMVLMSDSGGIEYLGFSPNHAISLDEVGVGCGSTKEVVWEPVRTMKLGSDTIPVYAQTAGTRLQ
jgi:hypothetical protein